MMKKALWVLWSILVIARIASAAELHVAVTGNDANSGTPGAPLRKIQRAADLAQPGDTITVHAGIYRERVSPPRGGTSDSMRIVYQAAPGETVVITGAERASDWTNVENDLKIGWNGDTVGHHIVRNNRISHCEQTGIAGSLGCIFSTIRYSRYSCAEAFLWL